MLKHILAKNPDKEYPANLGNKWTDDEEIKLLEELNNNIHIDVIAQNHNRTVGGINARRSKIAYDMYLHNISIDDIVYKTKLEYEYIKQIIEKNSNYSSKKINKKPTSIEDQIIEMKNEIKDLKYTIKELVEMIKAIYEFEES